MRKTILLTVIYNNCFSIRNYTRKFQTFLSSVTFCAFALLFCPFLSSFHPRGKLHQLFAGGIAPLPLSFSYFFTQSIRCLYRTFRGISRSVRLLLIRGDSDGWRVKEGKHDQIDLERSAVQRSTRLADNGSFPITSTFSVVEGDRKKVHLPSQPSGCTVLE